jgi:23S rRNA (uracil1939-C5)-methyltransferase
LVGFRERASHYITDMQACLILPDFFSSCLADLGPLIHQLHAREHCPQIELACTEQHTTLVLRHLIPLDPHDQQILKCFADKYRSIGLQWWLQPAGPDSIHPLEEDPPSLYYEIPEYGLQLHFKPTDFTQINPSINQVMVSRALSLLKVETTHRVIDWFCGIGNFSLPLATQAQYVLGVEGSKSLVQRAEQNLPIHQQKKQTPQTTWANTHFIARDLLSITGED